jgi:L-asparagine permease
MSSSLDSTPVSEQDTPDGYGRTLGNRQVQMIAIGGAIGVGLFLGAGGRLASAGPSLVLSYAVCGIAAFFVMRALAELVLHRPTGTSFVGHAREFIGPWAGFTVGWMYWLNWVGAGIAEITAVGYYVHKWLPQVPYWITALAALALLASVNLLSVKLFGELEFWFSVIKVLAIIVFIVVGIGLVVGGAQIGDAHASVGNLTDQGGFFPHGIGLTLMTLQSVVFAYAGIELVGVAAGEAKDPRKVIPKAVNSVLWRIGVFYVGTVLLLAMLMPWSSYSKAESPFVTVFSHLGVPAVGDVMNVIVLTAALSSANSGLYSTGRMLRALADQGEAPALAGRMSARKVPWGAIAITCAVYLLGVVLNAVVPQDAFDVATEIASLGTVSTWAILLICQMRLRTKANAGLIERPTYRMPGAPYTNVIVLGFLALVLVMMALAGGSSEIAVYFIPVIITLLILGWRFAQRRRRARV